MDYRRQRAFKKIDNIDQILKGKHVAIVGMGALGSHSAELITRMGIGNLTLIDFDSVEENNLCKTNIYKKKHIGKRKVKVAKKHLEKITEEMTIIIKKEKLTKENKEEILQGVDLILDGTDNFNARLIISDYSKENQIPWVYAAVDGMYGSVIPFIPKKTPCFRCAMNVSEKNVKTQTKSNGIVIPTISITTSYQITEAIKILCDKIKDVVKEERVFDIYHSKTNYLPLTKNKDCDCMEV